MDAVGMDAAIETALHLSGEDCLRLRKEEPRAVSESRIVL